MKGRFVTEAGGHDPEVRERRRMDCHSDLGLAPEQLAQAGSGWEVEDLVDAALVGFDRKELVTIPPVPDAAAWEAFEKARAELAAGFSNAKPAARYRT